jgi:hypothetical protein
MPSLFSMRNWSLGWQHTQRCHCLLRMCQGRAHRHARPITHRSNQQDTLGPLLACRTGHLVPIWQPPLGPYLAHGRHRGPHLPLLKWGSYVWMPNKVQISYCSCQIGPGTSYSFQQCPSSRKPHTRPCGIHGRRREWNMADVVARDQGLLAGPRCGLPPRPWRA